MKRPTTSLAQRTSLFTWIVGAVGCFPATASYTALNPVTCGRPRIEKEVTFVTQIPAEPHVEAVIIEVDMNESGAKGTEEALRMMRQLANERGCHAVSLASIVAKRGEHYYRSHDAILDLVNVLTTDTQDRKQISGTCVVYVDPACASAQAAR
jgi:hypothetical protein